MLVGGGAEVVRTLLESSGGGSLVGGTYVVGKYEPNELALDGGGGSRGC